MMTETQRRATRKFRTKTFQTTLTFRKDVQEDVEIINYLADKNKTQYIKDLIRADMKKSM